jgi:hypothetical protein
MASVQGEFISWTKILSPPRPPQKPHIIFPDTTLLSGCFHFSFITAYKKETNRNTPKHTSYPLN